MIVLFLRLLFLNSLKHFALLLLVLLFLFYIRIFIDLQRFCSA